MINDLMSIPTEIAVAMGCGYAGYFIAHLGRRDHHKQIDIALSTAVFGLIALLVFRQINELQKFEWLSGIVAFMAAAIAGALWNSIFRSWFAEGMRGITHSDDLVSAWKAIPDAKGYYAEQLTVKLVDGTWLHCDDMSKFENSPNKSCVFGGEGDLLMYVTHFKSPGDTEYKEKQRVQDTKYGDLITYIPKAQIVRVEFRRSK